MFGRGFTIFRLFGFEVRIDPSWIFLALLVAWSLAQGLFPVYAPGLAVASYWLLGVAGVIGLVVSIVVHEFSHSLVARRFGLPIGGISLFLFGGVAEMTDEPPAPKAEFLMAVAGPISSFMLAGLFGTLESAGSQQGWPLWLTALLFYLTYLNLVLAIFNLVPAYPLDGGRMLRAGLWAWRRDIHKATYIAALIGRGFGLGLIVLGLLTAFGGYAVSGLWWILIGMFLRFAAGNSYKQLLLRERMAGVPVRRYMSEKLVTVPPDITLRELLEQYVYKYHHRLYPVVENGNDLVGCIDARQLTGISADQRERRTVADISRSCDPDTTVTADSDAAQALSLMLRTGNSRLVVTDGHQLAGVVTLQDLLKDFGRA
jgi:Zn-dependent protease/predicted transcriptional regulator